MDIISYVAFGVGGIVGVGLLYLFFGHRLRRTEQESGRVAAEAELSRHLEVEEKLRVRLEELEQSVRHRQEIINHQESKLSKRENALNQQAQELSTRESRINLLQEELNTRIEIVKTKKEEAEKVQRKQIDILEKIAGINAKEAKENLLETLKGEARVDASFYVRKFMEEAHLTATRKAQKIIVETIQRISTEKAAEHCVSVFNIDDDGVKGKIIGREGRNIRTLEEATGVEIIVDDTPGAVIISSFEPLRREIAMLSLHRLVKDGRIHPARIEEVVKKTEQDIGEEIIDIGEQTLIDLGIHGLHPELIRMVGAMRYRSSYGQNLLQHSREVARLCATMAAALGLNVKLAKRAGLLHDIGKVDDKNTEVSHALAGMALCEKYKEHPEVCNAVGAHHDEIEMEAMISPIVQACDAISGSRLGARREMEDVYIKRLESMEKIALGHEGVVKSYAIQAGRELRVIADAGNVSDEKAEGLAFDISQQIEQEMQYPGQIKITVIRERRAVSYAR